MSAGNKIFGMIFLVAGICLTIIGGILLGMFFLYPLGNVIPKDQYISVFKEEFNLLVIILGVGIFILIIGFMFEIMVITEEYDQILSMTNNKKELNENYKETIEKMGFNKEDVENLMKKKILSDK